MTALLVFLGATFVGLAAWLVLHAARLPRIRQSEHLAEIAVYGGGEPVATADLAGGERTPTLGALAERLGIWFADAVPALTPLRRGELSAAGLYDVSADAVHGYRLMAAATTALIVLGYAVALGGGISLVLILVVIAAAALGWFGPALVIRQRGRNRLSEIDRELPELIDLLVATVEAGLAIGGSLTLVSGRFQGALGDELRLTLHHQGLGISTEAALRDMVERVDTPSVRAFSRTMIRAESMGVSVGPVLRSLAGDMRRRRRQNAQERVQKTPVKMLFPLIFLIFPAMFIVLLYPALYTILHQLGG